MNLLSSLGIRVRPRDQSLVRFSLPSVFAALTRDEIESFPAQRPFHRHAWHAVLVQLAALALVAADRSDLPEDEAAWATLLRGLTPDFTDDAPWSLVAPPERPAFLQPPAGPLAELKTEVATPDGLDLLVAAKNHELKKGVMGHAEPDDWLFALVSLQTMQGYSGAFNFGASRMNGGFANRAGIGIAPGDDARSDGAPGQHFRRDVVRLLAHRPTALDGVYARENGLGLVWLRPWDGTQSIRTAELDPYYIDICRRVRLVETNGRLHARTGNSKVARINPIGGGLTGDPWAPVVTDKGETKVFTADGGGFGYRRMVELMFGERFTPAPLQVVADDTDPETGLAVLARALVRGQGKTEGYHERRVPLSRQVGRKLGKRDGEPIARAAEARVKCAGEIQDRVLKTALLALFENGPDQVDFRDDGATRRAEAFLERFDKAVDADFFPALWREFEDGGDADAERNAWVLELLEEAKRLVDEADRGASKAVKRRYKARAAADAVLFAAPRRSDVLKRFFEGAHT